MEASDAKARPAAPAPAARPAGGQAWDVSAYARNARFVAELG